MQDNIFSPQAIDLLPVKDMLHVLAIAKVGVHILLYLRRVATHHLHQFGGQMLRVQCIYSPEDEVVDRGRHLLLYVHHALLLLLGRARLATAQDGRQRLPAELLLRPEDARIREVDHREELLKVILHGRAREEDATLAGDGTQRHGRLILAILESMGLVAD